MQAAEVRHSATRPVADMTAYDLYLRALAQVGTYGRERRLAALGLLDQAIVREPGYAPALALAAMCRVDLENYDWADDQAELHNRQAAIALARQALLNGPDDPGVLGRAALALGRFGEDISGALALIDRALTLNPSFAAAWYWSGWLRLFAGDADVAIQHFETSMRLNPRGQRGFHLSGIGMAHLLERRFDEAIAALRVSLEELPDFTPSYRSLAAAYGHAGRLEEAQAMLRRLAAMTAVFSPTTDPLRNPRHREIMTAGLRLAAGKPSPA